MPVYHFTVHAYRSWRPDHPRGYVQRDKGYLPSDPNMADRYDERAGQEPNRFDDRTVQEVLVIGCIDICRRRGWRLHGVATDPTHLHWLVSWPGFTEWGEVLQVTKNVLALLLNRVTEQKGRRWFVRNGSRKRVADRGHLDYLLGRYLPDHRGPFWREGHAVPDDRYGIFGS